MAGVFIAGVIAWATGFFSRLASDVTDVWGQLMASIDGLSVGGLLAGAGMLVIIVAIIGN